MKKVKGLVLSLVILIGFSFGAADQANAATKAKTYKNCTELNKVYKLWFAVAF